MNRKAGEYNALCDSLVCRSSVTSQKKGKHIRTGNPGENQENYSKGMTTKKQCAHHTFKSSGHSEVSSFSTLLEGSTANCCPT